MSDESHVNPKASASKHTNELECILELVRGIQRLRLLAGLFFDDGVTTVQSKVESVLSSIDKSVAS